MWPSGWPWPSSDVMEEHGAGGAPVAAAELAAPRRRAAATDARRPNDDPRQCGPAAGPGRRQIGGKSTAQAVRQWLQLNSQLRADAPLLPTRDGRTMTRANVAQRLALAVDAAAARYPELKTIRISPHVVRHSTAMSLLQAGSDPCEI